MGCCEAEGAVTSTSWQYVGEGQGAYTKAQTYNYVGEGAGSFDKETTVSYYGWKFKPCCMGLGALLLLSGLIYLLSTALSPTVPDTGSSNQIEIMTPAPTPAPAIIITPAPVVTTTEPYDCETRELWSIAKKMWCCKNYGVGCTTTTIATPAPTQTPVVAPIIQPAPVVPVPIVTEAPTVKPSGTSSCPYDCNAGYDEWPMQWVKGWGGAKKIYCCKTAHRGCPSELPPPSGAPPSGVPAAPDQGPYDCVAGYHPCYSCLVKHWSANKLDWCCEKKDKGCKSNTPMHM